MIIFLVCLLLLGTFVSSDAADLGSLEQSIKSFDYEGVIRTSENILRNQDLDDTQTIMVYRYRALAHYSLMQMELALKDFEEILKIDPEYTLDPITTSPKIISFYNQFRSSLSRGQKTVIETSVQIDTVEQLIDNTNLVRNAALRSVLVPGWGHLYTQHRTKGWLLVAGSVVSMGASIYLIYDCDQKRDQYLSEIDSEHIPQRYNAYNDAYQFRNAVLGFYALYWIYTQTDLLLFTNLAPVNNDGFSLAPGMGQQGQALLTFSWNW